MNSQFEYKTAMDSLHYTGEQKALLAERAAQAARQSHKRAHRPLLRTALIAACLTAALAVTAGATGVLKSAAEAFAPIFGGSAAQTEIIDKIGYPIGASDTDHGVTITADAILGDTYNAAIVFTITRDDGTIFDYTGNEYGYLPLRFDSDDVDFGILGGSHGGSYFLDQDPGDNTIQWVVTQSSDVPLIDHTVKVTMKNLCVWDDATGSSPILEGKWTMKFNAAYEDASITLGGGETFQQDGMTFTVDGITVSPVAFKVDYTVDSQIPQRESPSGQLSDADSQEQARYFENVEVLLKRTDGTVMDLSNTGGSIDPDNGTTVCSKTGFFNEILPMEEIESISVGGVVFPLAQ